MSKIACVAVVKNEQRHIAEWIAYQFAIGFDAVILYDNQSSDETVVRAKAFMPSHDVRVIDWPVFAPDYQTRSYENAARTFAGEFDWLAFFDTDEFLVISSDFDLRAILGLWSNAAAIGVPWAIFGSSGHINWPDGLVIEEFVYRSQPSFGPNRHIKSIIRPQRMKSCLNAHAFEMDGVYRGLGGEELSWSQPGVLDREPDYRMGKLHHYFTRSQAHWDAKIRRGYHDTDRKASEFEAYDRNEVFDDSAARYASVVSRKLAMMPLRIVDKAQKSSHRQKLHQTELSALLTAFGTLLCWRKDDQKLIHCAPDDLSDYHLVYWRRGQSDELVAMVSGRLEAIDPRSGRPAPSAMEAPLIVVDGEKEGDIAFDLGNGFFLSARQGGWVDFHVRARQAWECFTPISAQDSPDPIETATRPIRSQPV